MKGLLCVCNKASTENCTDEKCIQHKTIQPEYCGFHNLWNKNITSIVLTEKPE